MTPRRNSYANWTILFLAGAIPRILGAFFLPNAFGDAYVYIQEIGTLSTKISTGAFRLVDLFGFWLPLYQFIAALLNVFIKNGFYSGKIVAAIFGAGTCLFIYLITQRLTNNDTAALLMFLLIALNPLHIFYSASAMTDVPHAFLVCAALYFVIARNWITAAIFAALAGLTRVESWMLIALIPFIQLIRERRISITAILILIIPPLLWFYISWMATGNWLACFVQRQDYHDWLLTMNPAIAHFSLVNVLKDTATLLVSTDIAVLIASFAAAWFVIKHAREIRNPTVREGAASYPATLDDAGTLPHGRVSAKNGAQGVLSPALFFFAFLGLLVAAYLTHQQPIIFPRYGLILFTLGLPILAWTFRHIRNSRPQIARTVLIGIIVIVALDASIQFAGAVGTIKQYRAQRAVADYLRDHFDQKMNGQIFCDDGTVRVLSGIPEDRFVTSSQAPRDAAAFPSFLQSAGVEYLVVVNTPSSNPATTVGLNDLPAFESFQPVFRQRTSFIPTDIWLLKKQK